MEIYLVRALQISDFEVLRNDCEVFTDKEKAETFFNEIVNKERAYAEENEWEISEDTETYFECGADGRFGENASYTYFETKNV